MASDDYLNIGGEQYLVFRENATAAACAGVEGVNHGPGDAQEGAGGAAVRRGEGCAGQMVKKAPCAALPEVPPPLRFQLPEYWEFVPAPGGGYVGPLMGQMFFWRWGMVRHLMAAVLGNS